MQAQRMHHPSRSHVEWVPFTHQSLTRSESVSRPKHVRLTRTQARIVAKELLSPARQERTTLLAWSFQVSTQCVQQKLT